MEKVLGRIVLVKIKGYSLIESMVAIVILTLSLSLSAQLISSPLLGSSHHILVDAEHVCDSLNSLAQKGLLYNQLVVNRTWGACVVTETISENQQYSFFEITAVTHFGFKIPIRKGFYAIPLDKN
jgi:prepilin-type N-terminal cleavage/methylation domain-containing protein